MSTDTVVLHVAQGDAGQEHRSFTHSPLPSLLLLSQYGQDLVVSAGRAPVEAQSALQTRLTWIVLVLRRENVPFYDSG